MDPKFATSFAPYIPPPDEPSALPPQSTPTKVAARASAWFQAPSSTPATYANSTPNAVSGANPYSYQAGGLPTFGNGSAGITGFGGGAGAREEAGGTNMWETRFGWRVDVLAAVAYLGGPVSALLLLILETQNDYIRFHAYQSALLITPLLLLRLFAALVGFWGFLQTLLTLLLVGSECGMAFIAYRDANSGGLVRYHLPYIGEYADLWVGDE